MIDIVYPLGKGSQWNNYEIRYSLRSIEKHLSGVGKVWIVGLLPDFLTNVNHIPAEDPTGTSDWNILHKVKIACNTEEVSENFLFMNDDHYILKPFEADKFPNYYHGTIAAHVKHRGTDSYGRRCNESDKFLKEQGLETKFFDVHYPIIYNKKAFLDVFSKIDPHNRFGYILKSIYGNVLKLEGVDKADTKNHLAPRGDDVVFSTSNRVSAAVARFLQEKFPKKSIYEK